MVELPMPWQAAPAPGAAPGHRLPRSPWLWLAVALYLLAWSLLPPLLQSSFALDVVESLSWGREWQWGTYKHPPLSPWLLHLFWRGFGPVGPYLLSQLCIGATLWLVWRTGLLLLTPERAGLGALLTMGVAFYTRPALEFNHNIVQMPLWAGLAWAMLAALQQGRLRHWLALGLLAGLGLLAKYSIAILLACLGLYLLLGPARRRLLQSGPWLALLLALLLLAPHLLWLWQSDWLPMVYASQRSANSSAHPRLAALGFLFTQALSHLPLALVLLYAAWRARRVLARPGSAAPQGDASVPAPSARRWGLHSAWPGYLLTIALAPGLLVTALGLLLGLRIRDMWGVPMWAFSGLLVLAWLPQRWLAAMRWPLLRALAVWLALATLLSLAYLGWGAQWRQRPARTDWPQAALAAQAQAQWQALSTCPLQVVAGNYWLAGLVAVPLPSQPSVLITGDARYSPWVTRQRLLQQGALWLRESNEPDSAPAPLDAVQPGPQMQVVAGQWQTPWPHDRSAAPLTLHWRAYVPSHCRRVSPGQPAQESAPTSAPTSIQTSAP